VIRTLPLSVFFLFLISFVSADEGPRPRFEVGTSFVWGNATELVLRDGTYNNPISRLVWDVPPSIALNLAVEWPWTNWTSTTVAIKGTFPVTTGNLVDEDWDTGSPNYYKYAKSTQTAILTSHWAARIEQDFYRSPEELHVGFGFLYRWTSWEGWNGSGHYQHDDGSTQDINFSGMLINYRQQWLIPYADAFLPIRFMGLKTTPSLRLSPMVFCYDVDNHNYAGAASYAYLDNTQGGFYGQAGLEIEFPGGPGFVWGVRGEWEMTWGATGSSTNTTSYQSLQTFSAIPDSAGAWFQEASLTVFVRN
jgi:outer membrane protease